MRIEILGTGCTKCKKLEANVREAVKNLSLDAEIVKVQEMEKILDYGVMSLPGIVVDDEVRSTGKLLSADEVAALLG